jgi:hypothetical protein
MEARIINQQQATSLLAAVRILAADTARGRVASMEYVLAERPAVASFPGEQPRLQRCALAPIERCDLILFNLTLSHWCSRPMPAICC